MKNTTWGGVVALALTTVLTGCGDSSNKAMPSTKSSASATTNSATSTPSSEVGEMSASDAATADGASPTTLTTAPPADSVGARPGIPVGKQLWTTSERAVAWSDSVVATLSDTTLTAHDAATGKTLWRKTVSATAAANNGQAIVDTPAGTVRIGESLSNGDLRLSQFNLKDGTAAGTPFTIHTAGYVRNNTATAGAIWDGENYRDGLGRAFAQRTFVQPWVMYPVGYDTWIESRNEEIALVKFENGVKRTIGQPVRNMGTGRPASVFSADGQWVNKNTTVVNLKTGKIRPDVNVSDFLETWAIDPEGRTYYSSGSTTVRYNEDGSRTELPNGSTRPSYLSTKAVGFHGKNGWSFYAPK